MLVVLVAMVIVLVIIGGAAIFARGIGDDDDGGGGGNGGGNSSGSQSQDDGDGGRDQVVGDNCEANLPPELNLVDCGYSVFQTGSEGMPITEAHVGFVIENVSGESLSGILIELEGFDAEGNDVALSGFGDSVGLLRPGERSALGKAGTIAGAEGSLDRVVISGDSGALSEPFPDMIPLGHLSVSNVEVEPGAELSMGNEGTKIRFAVSSEMDRPVQVKGHVLFRDEQGAIIGYGSDPFNLDPGLSADREIETTVPGIADVEVYVTTPPALS